MKLKDLKMPEGASKAAPAGGSGTGSGSKQGSEFKVAPVFDLIQSELQKVCPNFVRQYTLFLCTQYKI